MFPGKGNQRFRLLFAEGLNLTGQGIWKKILPTILLARTMPQYHKKRAVRAIVTQCICYSRHEKIHSVQSS